MAERKEIKQVNRADVMAYLINVWNQIAPGTKLNRSGAMQIMGCHALICEYIDKEKRDQVTRECIDQLIARKGDMIEPNKGAA